MCVFEGTKWIINKFEHDGFTETQLPTVFLKTDFQSFFQKPGVIRAHIFLNTKSQTKRQEIEEKQGQN